MRGRSLPVGEDGVREVSSLSRLVRGAWRSVRHIGRHLGLRAATMLDATSHIAIHNYIQKVNYENQGDV